MALAKGYGLPGPTVTKIAAVLLLGSVFLVLAPQRRRLASSVMVIGIAAGVVGGISNLATT